MFTLETTGADQLVNNVVNKDQQTFIELTPGTESSRVNGNQSVVTNSSGRSVAVWSSFGQDRLDPQSWGIYALIYKDKLGGEVPTRLQVNTTTLGNQELPSVAMDSKGNFVVVWQGVNRDVSGSTTYQIYAQRFNATGQAQNPIEILVNQETDLQNRIPRVAMVDDPTPGSTTDGQFIITWTRTTTAGTGDVYMRRFSNLGVALGDEELVNENTTNDQSYSSIAAHTDGSFVITWSSVRTGQNYDIWARLYDEAGDPRGDEFQVNSAGVTNFASDVDMDANGNFIVTWTRASSSTEPNPTTVDVYYKRFGRLGGARESSDQRANFLQTDTQTNSTVALDAQGNFVISWSSNLQDGSGWGVYARSFNFNNVAIGQEFKVNQFTNGDQRYATVSSNDLGDIRIVWSSFDQGGADRDWDVYQRVYKVVRPTATDDDSATTLRNTPVTIDVLSNDKPATGTTLNPASVQIVTQPDFGVAVANSNGTITFTPQVDFTGIVTFTYVVADNTGTFSEPATVTVTVSGLGPLTAADTATTDEDVPVAIDVLANDTPRDNPIDPKTVTIVTKPQHGTVVVNATTGVVTYTPAKDYNDTDSFTYTVRDTAGVLSAPAKVTITINPIPDPPTANNDEAATDKGVAVIIDVLANDTDPETNLNPASVAIVTAPANGTTSVDATGKVTYTPNPGFSGVDTFQYTVADTGGLVSNVATVTIVVNDPPVANNDTATTPEDIAVAINILANDTDSDGTIVPTSLVIVTQPLHGSLFIDSATGIVTYAPNANYNGPDSFTYTVNDNRGATSNVATVSITVLSVNDRPVANDDAAATDVNVPVTINILANDTDIDGTLVPSSVTIVSGPTNGTVTINPATGALTYTPNPGFAGGDLIIYTVKDNEGGVSNQARVQIRVGPPSTLSGRIYLDLNNNGIQDGTEAGIAGVSLTLLKTDGPITYVRNAVSGADGTYTFTDLYAGKYNLVETQPGIFLDGKITPAPGVPVGTVGVNQFLDITLGAGLNVVGFNFGERGLRAEFLASYQGSQIFLASGMGGTLSVYGKPAGGLSLANGDLWVSIDGGYSGPLTFQATPAGGTAGLTLYDNTLKPLASSTTSSGANGFSYTGTTGATYFLKISGTSTNVDLKAWDPTPKPVNVAPVLPSIGNQTVPAGQTISFYARATDANAGDKLSYSLAGTIPTGASIDPQTGLFTWQTPANLKGPVSFTIVVQDQAAGSDFETFQISAGAGNSTPTLSAADASSFVKSVYVDLLGRNSDAGGLNYFTQQLLAGATQQQIMASFLKSGEYLGRVVDGLYSKYLHRGADAGGRAAWIASLQGGTSQTDVAIAFLTSTEYVSRHTSNSSFIDGLYRDVLGRAPDTAGLNANVAVLQSSGNRAERAKFFLTSGERIDQVIAEQYGKLLGRAVDPSGKASFAAALAGSMNAADELAKALVSSQEYLTKAIRKFR